MADSTLLAKCTAKHAGRVALQLLASSACIPTGKDEISRAWCGKLPAIASGCLRVPSHSCDSVLF